MVCGGDALISGSSLMSSTVGSLRWWALKARSQDLTWARREDTSMKERSTSTVINKVLFLFNLDTNGHSSSQQHSRPL